MGGALGREPRIPVPRSRLPPRRSPVSACPPARLPITAPPSASTRRHEVAEACLTASAGGRSCVNGRVLVLLGRRVAGARRPRATRTNASPATANASTRRRFAASAHGAARVRRLPHGHRGVSRIRRSRRARLRGLPRRRGAPRYDAQRARHGAPGASARPPAPTATATSTRVVPHTRAGSAVHWSKLAAHLRALPRRRAEPAEALPHPGRRGPVEAYLASVHARAVAAGRRGAVCSDCHGAHDILPPAIRARRSRAQHVPETCGDVPRARRSPPTATASTARRSRAASATRRCAPTATASTASSAPREPTSPVFAANIPRETCGRCHGDARLSEKYGLAAAQVAALPGQLPRPGAARRAAHRRQLRQLPRRARHPAVERPALARASRRTSPRPAASAIRAPGTNFALGPGARRGATRERARGVRGSASSTSG